MKVSEAILTRRSVRAFLDKPVAKDTVFKILDLARRAPSGGNIQPWKVYVLTGTPLQNLVSSVMAKLSVNPEGEAMDYPLFPADLGEPYIGRKRKVGYDLYAIQGILRNDRERRQRHLARNYSLFDAPVGLFFTIDRQFGVGQFADLGMFLENIMLLARELGLDTCAQEAWAHWPKTVAQALGIPDQDMLFCGMALGYADLQAPVNRLETERAPIEEFVVFSGFD